MAMFITPSMFRTVAKFRLLSAFTTVAMFIPPSVFRTVQCS